jgi:hypothetical protein
MMTRGVNMTEHYLGVATYIIMVWLTVRLLEKFTLELPSQ